MTATTTPPRATIVMPVRNEERFLAAGLGAVLAQDMPDGALEVLVVDGLSEDRTREIVAELADGARFPVRLLDNPGRIAATALNIGLAESQADVIVRVDGHVVIPPHYVRRLLEALRRTGADVVGGAVLPVGDGLLGESIACAMRSPLGHGGASFRAGRGAEREADTVAFPAYRREVLLDAGGFDEEMVRNQDDDLHLRLRSDGKRILLLPDLVTLYHCRATRRGLFRQYFGYGLWKVVGWRKRGKLSSWRALAPAIVVAALGACAVLSAIIGVSFAQSMAASPIIDAGEAVALGLAAALLAFVGWYLHYAVPLSIASLFITPPPPGWRWLLAPPARILADMHIAYGLGFWWGVLRLGRPPRRAP